MDLIPIHTNPERDWCKRTKPNTDMTWRKIDEMRQVSDHLNPSDLRETDLVASNHRRQVIVFHLVLVRH
jgi:hypothetical protein